MWLKNLIVYRLPAKWSVTADALEKALALKPLQPCGSFEMESRGWLPPQAEGGYLYTQGKQWLLALGVEQKLLPATVIRQRTQDKAAEVARQQAHPVGRKQMLEIRDQVTNELMPRALSRRRITWCWIDAANGWLVVDAAADTKAEQFLENLRRAVDDLPLKRLDTQRSPGASMTQWLSAGKAPKAFSIDQDLELSAANESRAVVRYVRHSLDGKDIRDHIAGGKVATRLGMTWKDRISFVLTDQMQIKRVTFLDILKQESGSDAAVADENEQFDIDFALMAGELSLFLADLTAALGGEKAED
ncbi:MAG: recombination-associated protein RdgC [Proteobacteria bacterium]|nr:recombination-associated protein RdgC [Pseudomonadota bacterium]